MIAAVQAGHGRVDDLLVFRAAANVAERVNALEVAHRGAAREGDAADDQRADEHADEEQKEDLIVEDFSVHSLMALTFMGKISFVISRLRSHSRRP